SRFPLECISALFDLTCSLVVFGLGSDERRPPLECKLLDLENRREQSLAPFRQEHLAAELESGRYEELIALLFGVGQRRGEALDRRFDFASPPDDSYCVNGSEKD